MNKHNTFKSLWKDIENSHTYLVEKSILDFTTELYQLMKNRNISNKDMAEKIGTSQAYITKVFRGNINFTISTMLKLTNALDGRLNIHITPNEEKIVQWYRVLEERPEKEISNWGKIVSKKNIVSVCNSSLEEAYG